MKKCLFLFLFPFFVDAKTLTVDEAENDPQFLEQEVTIAGVLWRSKMPVYLKKDQTKTPVAVISLYSSLEKARDYAGSTVFFDSRFGACLDNACREYFGEKIKVTGLLTLEKSPVDIRALTNIQTVEIVD